MVNYIAVIASSEMYKIYWMMLPYPFRDRYLYIIAIATTIPIINNNNIIAPTVAPAITPLP